MKYLILIMLFASCSLEKSCTEKLDEAKAQYIKALSLCGSSQTAIMEVTTQYNAKKESILNTCK